MLHAIRWIKQAWKVVSPRTIANCFRHSGVIPKEGEEDQADPCADLDNNQDPDVANVSELVTQLTPDIAAEQYLQDEQGLYL